VYTLHPAIRKFLDLWIAVVRPFSNLQKILVWLHLVILL
jgi:hypothetical protein